MSHRQFRYCVISGSGIIPETHFKPISWTRQQRLVTVLQSREYSVKGDYYSRSRMRLCFWVCVLVCSVVSLVVSWSTPKIVNNFSVKFYGVEDSIALYVVRRYHLPFVILYVLFVSNSILLLCHLTLPYLTFGVGRLLHLPSTEAISVRPNAQPRCNQKITVIGCEAETWAVKLKSAVKLNKSPATWDW